MASHRLSHIELNFDGLTDAITNLTGSLVLLVVLMFAMTTPKEQGFEEPRFPEPQIGEAISMVPLVEKLQIMRAEIEQLAQQTQQIEDRLPELTIEIKQLEEKWK